jgi:hypothetical protein
MDDVTWLTGNLHSSSVGSPVLTASDLADAIVTATLADSVDCRRHSAGLYCSSRTSSGTPARIGPTFCKAFAPACVPDFPRLTGNVESAHKRARTASRAAEAAALLAEAPAMTRIIVRHLPAILRKDALPAILLHASDPCVAAGRMRAIGMRKFRCALARGNQL